MRIIIRKINIDLVYEREFLSAVETTSMTTTNISSNENTDTDNYNSRDDNNNTNSIHRNLVDYDESLEGDLTKTINSTRIFNEPIEKQFNNYKINQKDKYIKEVQA